ncbi:MAG: GNAT family N-acetyltransferase [Proteobacteria bacterium]|nr:MAG: GNAT family N-acetyltransferase [Pseudomonadota bacterium]
MQNMPVIEIVQAEDGHLESFYDIVARTYHSGDPIPEERRERRAAYQRFVAVRDGQAVGAYSLLDHDIWVRNGVIRCAGVAAVAVPPEARDGGVGAAMMKGAIERMRTDGYAMATLYAYREPFYAKSGYATVGRRLKIECPAHRLPKGGGLPVRRLTPEDWPLLETCYQDFSRRHNGMALRDREKWQRILGEHRPLTIYAVGEPVEGYVVVSHKSEFWSTDHISEFVWSTPEGYQALMGVLRGLATNKNALTWFEPSDGPFAFHHLDMGTEISLMRPIMGRIVDTKAALEACCVEGDGSFSFTVVEGESWRVEFSQGETTVRPAETGEFSLTIGALTQALYGEPSLADLLRTGYVGGSVSPDALAFFTPGSGFCLDYF